MFESDKLFSYRWDRDWHPETPEDMWLVLHEDALRRPLEMTYTHVSSEEVCLSPKIYPNEQREIRWTGVQRDWDRLQYMMDRDTQVMQRNN